MDEKDLQLLRTHFERKLSAIPTDFHRSLYDEINWNSSIIGIRGPRGSGKSTLLMQRIHEAYASKLSDVLYVSLDNLWFANHDFMEMVEYLYVHGIRTLFVDEVHKYKDWALAFKNIYDTFPGMGIIYTGSSALKIDNARVDLSRRQTVHELGVMSFREFLCIETGKTFSAHTLEEILSDHASIARSICADVNVIPLFKKYLKSGEYPFYLEAGEAYLTRLLESSQLILESDLPEIDHWEWASIQKAKKLLSVISSNVPMMPNVTRLAEQLECTRETCLKMMYALERARLLMLLQPKVNTYKQLSRPAKIYLGDTNLMYAFTGSADEGNIRETFFLNQMSHRHDVRASDAGDFTVDGKYVFEVGGSRKSFQQVKDLQNSYLAIDDTEIGYGARIPLWLFGMMY